MNCIISVMLLLFILVLTCVYSYQYCFFLLSCFLSFFLSNHAHLKPLVNYQQNVKSNQINLFSTTLSFSIGCNCVESDTSSGGLPCAASHVLLSVDSRIFQRWTKMCLSHSICPKYGFIWSCGNDSETNGGKWVADHLVTFRYRPLLLLPGNKIMLSCLSSLRRRKSVLF